MNQNAQQGEQIYVKQTSIVSGEKMALYFHVICNLESGFLLWAFTQTLQHQYDASFW